MPHPTTHDAGQAGQLRAGSGQDEAGLLVAPGRGQRYHRRQRRHPGPAPAVDLAADGVPVVAPERSEDAGCKRAAWRRPLFVPTAQDAFQRLASDPVAAPRVVYQEAVATRADGGSVRGQVEGDAAGAGVHEHALAWPERGQVGGVDVGHDAHGRLRHLEGLGDGGRQEPGVGGVGLEACDARDHARGRGRGGNLAQQGGEALQNGRPLGRGELDGGHWSTRAPRQLLAGRVQQQPPGARATGVDAQEGGPIRHSWPRLRAPR